MAEEIITLRGGDIEVSVAPTFGNNSYSMKVRGQEILWHPQPTLAEWRQHPASGGVPLLAPWANRLDDDAFFANGKRYRLNPDVLNLHRDGNGLPIHGLVMYASEWKVMRQGASSVTSRLDLWRVPAWTAQFPFAHSIEMTHRLDAGGLVVETLVENHSSEPMPLSLGYHPYFQLTDSPRDEWTVSIPATEHVSLTNKLVPSGERTPNTLPDPCKLAGRSIDDVFTGLTGKDFVLQGRRQSIRVRFGPKYPVGIVYAPNRKAFTCFEPMSAQTNAFNLTERGIEAGLQQIAPGGTWRESFSILPEGF